VTNLEAIGRIRQQINYLHTKLTDGTMSERAAFWKQLDIEAFEMAIAALQYAHDVAEYKAAQPHDEIPAS